MSVRNHNKFDQAASKIQSSNNHYMHWPWSHVTLSWKQTILVAESRKWGPSRCEVVQSESRRVFQSNAAESSFIKVVVAIPYKQGQSIIRLKYRYQLIVNNASWARAPSAVRCQSQKQSIPGSLVPKSPDSLPQVPAPAVGQQAFQLPAKSRYTRL